MMDLGIDLSMDTDNLYIEESFTDMKVGTIRRLTPVLADGSADENRPKLYLGHTQLMSPNGPLPVSCMIEAASLPEAIQKFPDVVKQEVERIIELAQKAEKKEDSRIIVPGQS